MARWVPAATVSIPPTRGRLHIMKRAAPASNFGSNMIGTYRELFASTRSISLRKGLVIVPLEYPFHIAPTAAAHAREDLKFSGFLTTVATLDMLSRAGKALSDCHNTIEASRDWAMVIQVEDAAFEYIAMTGSISPIYTCATWHKCILPPGTSIG